MMSGDKAIHPSGKAMVSLRIGGAVACNIFLHVILLNTFIIITNINVTNPLLWIKKSVGSLLTMQMWLYSVPLAVVTLAQGIVSCREYLIPPACLISRFSVLCNLFNVYNMVVCFLYAYVGFSLPLIYSSFMENGLSSFSVTCKGGVESDKCLNEDRLFLVLGGTWIGFYYFVHNHLFKTRYLDFPFLQQRKSLIVKSSVLPAVRYSMKYTTTPLSLFVILYYFKGSTCRGLFSHVFSSKLNTDGEDGDGLFGFLSLGRLYYLWLFSSLTVFTLRMMEVMVRIYLMQRYEFSMYPTPGKPTSGFILEEALGAAQVPIVRHLGYWDLALVAETDKERRKEVFTLSQPGGHPYTWNGIKRQCFNTINDFTLSLEQAIKKPSSPSTQSISSPVDITNQQDRPESTDYFLNTKLDRPLFCTETLSVLVRFVRHAILTWLLNHVGSVCDSRPVRYMFGEVARLRVSYLILHSLPVAWAAESLSYLLSASLLEDSYGILQADIPQVVATLLHLQSALDSLYKNPTLVRRFHTLPSLTVSKMHQTLTSKVKRSLYHLAIHFKPFITDLQLSKQDEKRLLSYCSFRE